MPISVLGFYGALALWLVFVVQSLVNPAWRRWAAAFGLGLLLFLNGRYVFEGIPSGIAFFVSLYDAFDNLGLSAGQVPAAMATCAGNACSLWGETYLLHQSWGVAFFERFLDAPSVRTNALYLHLIANSMVFILFHIQLFWPGGGSQRQHAWLGRLTMLLLTVGTVAALYLASEHDAVGAYGGVWAEWGFWSMSLCVYGAAMMGWRYARSGDWTQHRIWMIRFAGAMYGAFWLFRFMLIVTGPLLREWESVSLLLSIWLSAPLGLVIADRLRRAWDARKDAILLER